jgi:hypothetical protein
MSPRGEALNVLNDVGRLPLLSEGGGHYSKYVQKLYSTCSKYFKLERFS